MMEEGLGVGLLGVILLFVTLSVCDQGICESLFTSFRILYRKEACIKKPSFAGARSQPFVVHFQCNEVQSNATECNAIKCNVIQV